MASVSKDAQYPTAILILYLYKTVLKQFKTNQLHEIIDLAFVSVDLEFILFQIVEKVTSQVVSVKIWS